MKRGEELSFLNYIGKTMFRHFLKEKLLKSAFFYFIGNFDFR